MLGRLVAIASLVFASFTAQAADNHAHNEAPLGDISKRYKVLAEPQVVPQDGRIHIEEMFWYGCGHCFSLEEHVNKWKATKPADVEFTRIPAMFGKAWVIHAQLYYISEVLGLTDKTHSAIFNSIHLNKQKLTRKSEQQAFFADFGVSEEDFNKAYNSFTVKSRMKQGDQRVRAYRVTGVPAVVVNGKYLVDAGSAGGQHNMFKVIDHLIEQERK